MPSYIPELKQRLEQVSLKAEENFAGLKATQLNWKADPQSWSIAQCLDHLMRTNELYFPILTASQNAQPPQNIFTRLRFFSGFFGRMLRKQLGEEVIRKSKTPKKFQPTQSDLSAEILQAFLAHQSELLAHFDSLPEKDYSKIMMISPAASFVTYSVEDALYILAGHEERHLAQATRVMQMPSFPTNLQS